MRRYYSGLNNPITYGYFLVYLPFDLNYRVQRTYKWQAWIVRLLKVAGETLPRRLTKASEQRGHAFSASTSARSGGHPVFSRHNMDRFTCQHVVGISVQNFFLRKG
jgi:hypothetical protein